MAGVTPDLAVDVTWDRGSGVTAPELAATWCSLKVQVKGNPVTLVDDARGGGLRRAVHTSAYPLAEWVALRWWLLQSHVRPSVTPVSRWSWQAAERPPWLEHHNLRGAGEGMPWPDLTLVPEGGVSRLVWRAGPGVAGQPVRFLTSGDEHLPAASVRRALAVFVTTVIDRLEEAGVHETTLQQEWSALADLAPDERDFASAAARLGLDPFDVPPALSRDLETVGTSLSGRLLDELLDSANPSQVAVASAWVQKVLAKVGVSEVALRAEPVSTATHSVDQPWTAGYVAARRVRETLGLKPTDRADLSDLVKVGTFSGEAAGVQGVVVGREGHVGLGLPAGPSKRPGRSFAQARALWLAHVEGREVALLDPTGTVSAKSSRAFAAELLAPSAGIAECLSALGAPSDRALEAVAKRFGTSALLVQRQFDNQLA